MIIEYKVYFVVVLFCGLTAIVLGAGLILALITAWLGQIPAVMAASFVCKKTQAHNFLG